MKIEIGKCVSFFNEQKGVVAIRRGEVTNHLTRRTPSGKVEDVVTVEFVDKGVKYSKTVKASALYPSKWDAAMALHKKVEPIIDPFYEHKVRPYAPLNTEKD